MFRSGVFGHPVDGFGRAIASWNRIVIKMIVSWEIFALRTLHARSARKCVFLLHKAALKGRFEV